MKNSIERWMKDLIKTIIEHYNKVQKQVVVNHLLQCISKEKYDLQEPEQKKSYIRRSNRLRDDAFACVQSWMGADRQRR